MFLDIWGYLCDTISERNWFFIVSNSHHIPDNLFVCLQNLLLFEIFVYRLHCIKFKLMSKIKLKIFEWVYLKPDEFTLFLSCWSRFHLTRFFRNMSKNNKFAKALLVIFYIGRFFSKFNSYGLILIIWSFELSGLCLLRT